MVECGVVKERMPELLVEALGSPEREEAHVHIERCPVCASEWSAFRDTWAVLGELPEVAVPEASRRRFAAHLEEISPAKVVEFRPRRRMPRWLTQAAAVAVIAGGSYWAGSNAISRGTEQPITGATQVAAMPFSLSESQIIPASQLSPAIEGRPQIENVQFVSRQGAPGEVAISFNVTSHVTVTGKKDDPGLVNLVSYVLQNREQATGIRSDAIRFVRAAYAQQPISDPSIVRGLTEVLKNEAHEGSRIEAVETLTNISGTHAAEARAALIEALQNDPNPAVRIKAVDALAKLATSGGVVDQTAVETLRKKAAQPDENSYVRVKAAEALGQMNL